MQIPCISDSSFGSLCFICTMIDDGGERERERERECVCSQATRSSMENQCSYSVVSDSATPWTDCSLPGSCVHGILQARILEWVAIPFSRGSSWPRDQTWVSSIAGRFFTIWATREARICVCYAPHNSVLTQRSRCRSTDSYSDPHLRVNMQSFFNWLLIPTFP